MSYRTQFLLPALGQGDGSGRLVNWLKQPGDNFEKDETLLEVETDKALVEVPAPAAGTLVSHIAAVDDTVDLGGALAEVEFEGEAPAQPAAEETAAGESAKPAEPAAAGRPPEKTGAAPAHPGKRLFATPLARKLAAECGVDLAGLHGSGKQGRIVAADVRAGATSGATAAGGADVEVQSREQRVPVDGGTVFAQSWLPAQRRSSATLFLLHGLFAGVDAWSASAALLARRGVPVVAVDLPCHGLTTAPASDFDAVVEVIADSVRALVSGPVVLAGHSFGGAVGARLAAAPGIDVAGLALIAPLGLGTEINTTFVDGMSRARGIDALRREMRKLTARAMPVGNDYLAQLHSRLAGQAENLAALCESVAAGGVQQLDIHPDLESAGLPVTLIHGRADEIVPWQHALNAPPTTALHLPAGVGHMPQWEASALTTDLLAAACGV